MIARCPLHNSSFFKFFHRPLYVSLVRLVLRMSSIIFEDLIIQELNTFQKPNNVEANQEHLET